MSRLLILGAGANVPYGFPTGERLRENIIYGQEFSEFFTSRTPSSQKKIQALIKSYKEYKVIFSKSHINSIDSHLFRNPSFLEIGKYCIAGSLLNHEEMSDLEHPEHPKQDWMKYLWNLLTDGLSSYEDFSKKWAHLKIITFNYDRSLEKYFLESIWNTFREEVPLTTRNVNQIPFEILHVYGSLGPLDLSNGEIDNYGRKTEGFDIVQAVQEIRIMREERERGDDITNLVKNSKKLFFLGFGFDELNLEKLGLRSTSSFEGKEVFISSYGRDKMELDKLKTKIGDFKSREHCIDLLKSFWIYDKSNFSMTARSG